MLAQAWLAVGKEGCASLRCLRMRDSGIGQDPDRAEEEDEEEIGKPTTRSIVAVLARTYKCMSMVLNQEKSDGLSRTTESPDILHAPM